MFLCMTMCIFCIFLQLVERHHGCVYGGCKCIKRTKQIGWYIANMICFYWKCKLNFSQNLQSFYFIFTVKFWQPQLRFFFFKQCIPLKNKVKCYSIHVIMHLNPWILGIAKIFLLWMQCCRDFNQCKWRHKLRVNIIRIFFCAFAEYALCQLKVDNIQRSSVERIWCKTLSKSALLRRTRLERERQKTWVKLIGSNNRTVLSPPGEKTSVIERVL